MALSILQRRLVQIALGLAISVGLYTTLGFFAAPSVVRYLLHNQAAQGLNSIVEVGKIETNPFDPSLSIRQLRFSKRGQQPWFQVERLHLDIGILSSVGGLQFAFDQIDLQQPQLRLHMRQGRIANLPFLQNSPAHNPSAEAEPSPPATAIPALLLKQLHIAGGNLQLSDFDRTPNYHKQFDQIDIDLRNLSTHQQAPGAASVQLRTPEDEILRWNGHIDLARLQSQGTLELQSWRIPPILRSYADSLPVELVSGRLSTRIPYDFRIDTGEARLHIESAEVQLDQIQLQHPDDTSTLAQIEQVRAYPIAMQTDERLARIGALRVEHPRIELQRLSDGSLHLPATAPANSNASLPATQTAETADAAGTAPAWSLQIDSIELAGGQLHWLDQSLHPTSSTRLAFDGQLWPFTIPAQDIQYDLRIAPASGGTLIIRGARQPDNQIDAQIQLAQLDLAPLHPYAREHQVDLQRGQLDARLELRIQPDHPLSIALDQLTITDLQGELPPRIALQIAEIGLKKSSMQLAYADQPLQLDLGPLRIDQPHLRVELPRQDSATEQPSQTTPADDTAEQPAAAPQLKLSRIQLAQGQIEFRDQRMDPRGTLLADQIELQAQPWTWRSEQPAQFSLAGRINQTAPLAIQGQLNPLQPLGNTRLELQLDHLPLAQLNPWATTYLGYQLQSGHLNLAFDWTLEDASIRARNLIKLDQMKLGQSTPGPEAIKAPLPLALALLRNRDNQINLDIPVEGQLDDPQFRLGKVIWQTIGNLLVRAVASPFDMLAGILGGGPELKQIEFVPGTAELSPGARKQADALAEILYQRPALALDLQPLSTPADQLQLARLALAEHLQQASAEEIQRVQDSAEYHQRLLERMQPEDAHLIELGNQRLRALQARLVEHPGVRTERIYAQVPVQDSDEPPQIRIQLRTR